MIHCPRGPQIHETVTFVTLTSHYRPYVSNKALIFLIVVALIPNEFVITRGSNRGAAAVCVAME